MSTKGHARVDPSEHCWGAVLYNGACWRAYSTRASYRKKNPYANKCQACKCWHRTPWQEGTLCLVCVKRSLRQFGEMLATSGMGFIEFRGPEE